MEGGRKEKRRLEGAVGKKDKEWEWRE